MSTAPLRIGGNSIWGEYFSGLIDEVRVYNRALTAAEVQADMTTPVAARDAATPRRRRRRSRAPAAGASVSGTVTRRRPTRPTTVGVAGVQFQVDGSGARRRGHDRAVQRRLGHERRRGREPHADRGRTRRRRQPHDVLAGDRDRRERAPPQFVNERVIIGLDEPTAMTFTPDGRMLIAERDGTVWVVQPGATPGLRPRRSSSSRASRTDNERGLLGITRRPGVRARTATSTPIYTHGTLRNRVSRFTATGNTAPASTELVVWQNIVNADIWHQGGDLHFGPDGYLYISVGDHLQSQTAQSLTSYNGKILRITRDGAAPADNPFNDGAGPNLDAIWARGLRNPFRFTIDAADRPDDHRRRRRGHARGGQHRRPRRELRVARPARARAARPG